MLRKNISVMNSQSEIIRAELYYRNAIKDAPVIVILPSVFGILLGKIEFPLV